MPPAPRVEVKPERRLRVRSIFYTDQEEMVIRVFGMDVDEALLMLGRLAPREREAVELVVRGVTYKEAAQRMGFLGEHRVQSMKEVVKKVMKKLDGMGLGRVYFCGRIAEEMEKAMEEKEKARVANG